VNGGTTVKVRGKGEPSPGGGPPGDLLLEVEVQPHPHLKRDGRNLRVDLPITVYEAVLGSEVRVPTLRGTATINLPAGTRAGQVLRVRGEGIGTPNGSAGDILARISIAAPVEVDDSLLELMRLFKAEHPYQPRDD